MSLRLVLLLVVLLAPGALAHGEETHVEPGRDTETGETVAPNEGYTGPGYEPYVYFMEGTWLYGQASVTPLGQQAPRHVRGHGDWLVWEDAARGDIYVHNVRAGTGYYVTVDAARQRNPAIWGDVVVYEDHANPTRVRIAAHFLETGETRNLSQGAGNHRSPSIHGDLVAWANDRNGTADIWGARLYEGGEFPIHTGPDKESDPLVLDNVVYFRTYRFNVWDVLAVDLARGIEFPLTSDTAIQGAPLTNGRDVLFLTQKPQIGWRLERYDLARERTYETALRFPDTGHLAMEGDRVIQQVRDVGKVQLVARNLTSAASTHVSGNLDVVSDPHMMDGTVYVPVRTKNGTSLLALQVSPFAFGKSPTLSITSPASSVSAWVRPVTVRGTLTTGPGWNEPVTFTYRINGGPPQAIPPGATWEFLLDNNGVEQGNHRILIRATFREGPPVETALTLVVPVRNANANLEELGPQYHAAKTMANLNAFVLGNPASWFLIPLVLILVVLFLIRLYIALRPRRDVVVAEYVPQED